MNPQRKRWKVLRTIFDKKKCYEQQNRYLHYAELQVVFLDYRNIGRKSGLEGNHKQLDGKNKKEQGARKSMYLFYLIR